MHIVSNGEFGKAAPMSLEQLVALNEEIVALVRAGVPLDRGLVELGNDMPGRLGRIAREMGDRMAGGESLEQVLASEEFVFPPVWRAVVEAGLRTGRLSSALEALSTTGRRAAELRRAIGISLIYPAIVVTVAYALFLFFSLQFTPLILSLYDDFALAEGPLLRSMGWLSDSAGIWGPTVPVLAVLAFGAWWYRSGRMVRSAAGMAGQPRRGWYRAPWPTLRTSLYNGRMATFTEILALLVQRQVPLPEGLVLAADASGDVRLKAAARELAERYAKGEVIRRREEIPRAFPPLMGWLLASGAGQPGLAKSLGFAAEQYRRRATDAATWTAIYLPIFVTAFVGGAVTLIQALAVFGPIINLLTALG
jgi:general secretion pathway protein F